MTYQQTLNTESVEYPPFWKTEKHIQEQEEKQIKFLNRQRELKHQLKLEKLVANHIANLNALTHYLTIGYTTPEKAVQELERLNNLFTNRYKNVDIEKD